MAFKQLQLPEVGTVKLYKRRGSRNIRLSVGHDGSVRVSLPTYVPFQAGLQFVQHKRAWITREQQRHRQYLLKSGDRIGKAHRLRLVPSPAQQRVSSRLIANEIVVS